MFFSLREIKSSLKRFFSPDFTCKAIFITNLMFYKVVDAILLFGGKDTIFPRNFQGFWGKCRDDDNENEGFNIKSPSEIASQK